jgi:hypothetical protein
MNAVDVMRYGHGTVLSTLDGVPAREWTTLGVCGVWSVKDIVAHLASYELALVDVLTSLTTGGPTPTLDRFKAGPGFNDEEVAASQELAAEEVLDGYTRAHERAMTLIEQIPEERRRQPGTLPWYGAEYALDDFIVYAFYGHKREHSAQINVFKDRLAG